MRSRSCASALLALLSLVANTQAAFLLDFFSNEGCYNNGCYNNGCLRYVPTHLPQPRCYRLCNRFVCPTPPNDTDSLMQRPLVRPSNSLIRLLRLPRLRFHRYPQLRIILLELPWLQQRLLLHWRHTHSVRHNHYDRHCLICCPNHHERSESEGSQRRASQARRNAESRPPLPKQSRGRRSSSGYPSAEWGYGNADESQNESKYLYHNQR